MVADTQMDTCMGHVRGLRLNICNFGVANNKACGKGTAKLALKPRFS